MARTFISQLSQVAASEGYDDSLVIGDGLVTGSTSLQTDLNAIRTMIKHAVGQANWYDPLANRDISSIDTDLQTVEEKNFLYRSQNLALVSIATGSNFVTLSTETGTAPTGNVAGASGAGVVVGLATYNAHSMAIVSGSSAVKPKNLISIRDAYTHDVLTSSLSGGQTIYGLLQVESGATLGAAIDDSANRAQISFVYENANGQLVAAPSSDIGGRVINYNYTVRDQFQNLPEDATLAGDVFVDVPEMFLMSDITLDRALDNQGSTPTTTTSDITVDMGAGLSWTFQSEGSDALKIDGNEIVVSSLTSSFKSDVNAFDKSITVDSTGTSVVVGNGTVSTSFGDDMFLNAGNLLVMTDVNNPANLAGLESGVKLAASASSWSDWSGLFGDKGIMDAVHWAYTDLSSSLSNDGSNLQSAIDAAISGSLRRERGNITVDNNISADTDVGLSSDGVDSTGLPPDFAGFDFEKDVEIYLNGVLLRPGTDSGNANDVYPGTVVGGVLQNLKFPYTVTVGSQIVVVVYPNSII